LHLIEAQERRGPKEEEVHFQVQQLRKNQYIDTDGSRGAHGTSDVAALAGPSKRSSFLWIVFPHGHSMGQGDSAFWNKGLWAGLVRGNCILGGET